MLPKRPPGSERSSQRIGPFPLNFYFRVRSQIIGDVFELYREAANAASPMDSVDPSYAQKLLCGLAAWSQSIGFASPHPDFTVVEHIHGGEGRRQRCRLTVCEGKPVYILGPTETVALIRQRSEQLQKYLDAT